MMLRKHTVDRPLYSISYPADGNWEVSDPILGRDLIIVHHASEKILTPTGSTDYRASVNVGVENIAATLTFLDWISRSDSLSKAFGFELESVDLNVKDNRATKILHHSHFPVRILQQLILKKGRGYVVTGTRAVQHREVEEPLLDILSSFEIRE